MAEIDCRYVMRTKWFISALRTSLRSIFTMAKAKSTANITITGLHLSKLFNPAIHFRKLGFTGRTLLSLFLNKFLMFNAPHQHHLNIMGLWKKNQEHRKNRVCEVTSKLYATDIEISLTFILFYWLSFD